MPESWRDYFTLLDQLSQCLEELTALEQEKTRAVLRDDLPGVDACVKKEQALSLSLRARESKRAALLAALGCPDAPLSALAERCPPEFRLKAREAARHLRDRYEIYRSAADVARTTLEVNLRQIEKIIEKNWGPEYLTDSGALAASGQPHSGGRRGGAFADIRA